MKFHLFRLDTINKKLLLPTLLLVTILIGALGSVLVVQQNSVLNLMMESKADSIVTMLATISEQYVINYDQSALENFVKDTAKDKDVAFAEYYDTDGTSLTGNVMKAPADTSHLLVYEHNIVNISGKMIGKVKVGFETSTLDRTSQSSITIVVVSLVVVLGLLAFGLMLIIRSVANPLKNAIGIAKRVADGDLTQRIQVKSRDETGQLMQALQDMNASLARIVSGVRDTTDTISMGSKEIAQGNAELSHRTEEQAASLEETASSMEELTSTVRQNAENARLANQLAARATDVAISGGQAVNEVVQTMASISASTGKIMDIIGVIEDIAFQTNILALNAAVEAAHAGQHGRGFAVVAAEVRNLAQRAAAAAKDITALIDDSVEKVYGGSKQVDQAGATMGEIVTAVKRVTDIMAEIAAASSEQSSGIEQVNQAIIQMDAVTQQNAALVEEAAAAAEAMQEQASDLMDAVSVFKLETGNQGKQATAAKPIVTPTVTQQNRPPLRNEKRLSGHPKERKLINPKFVMG